MKGRVLVVGLDCLGAEILCPAALDELPNVAGLVARGLSGALESTIPPITVPAWTAMFSGRDPGELGLYGFRNRRSYAYGDACTASSASVRHPRLWDLVGERGGRSIVVGVPQTLPPPRLEGVLVAGFEAGGAPWRNGSPATHPPELAHAIGRLVPGYACDVEEFRRRPREDVLRDVYAMTEKRFRLMEWLLSMQPWDLAIVCEIGPDRLHHCFWSDHDPSHPRHDPDSPHRRSILDYYRYLDDLLGRLLGLLPAGTTVLVASDHGAQPMHGGVFVNEMLRELGWLVLRQEPTSPTPLTPQLVDWSRTRAWGDGGYYGRVYLNVEGREQNGTIPWEELDAAAAELARLLGTVELPSGERLTNEVVRPEVIYRRVLGYPPDLLVFFGGMSWRSLGLVGTGRTWQRENDTGLDEANHARDGFYVLAGPGVPHARTRRASILDVTPTVATVLGLAPDEDLAGTPLLPKAAA